VQSEALSATAPVSAAIRKRAIASSIARAERDSVIPLLNSGSASRERVFVKPRSVPANVRRVAEPFHRGRLQWTRPRSRTTERGEVAAFCLAFQCCNKDRFPYAVTSGKVVVSVFETAGCEFKPLRARQSYSAPCGRSRFQKHFRKKNATAGGARLEPSH
jgi:hypothetical protein